MHTKLALINAYARLYGYLKYKFFIKFNTLLKNQIIILVFCCNLIKTIPGGFKMPMFTA